MVHLKELPGMWISYFTRQMLLHLFRWNHQYKTETTKREMHFSWDVTESTSDCFLRYAPVCSTEQGKKSPMHSWIMKFDVWNVGNGLSTRISLSDTHMPPEQSRTSKWFMMAIKNTWAESLGMQPSSCVTTEVLKQYMKNICIFCISSALCCLHQTFPPCCYFLLHYMFLQSPPIHNQWTFTRVLLTLTQRAKLRLSSQMACVIWLPSLWNVGSIMLFLCKKSIMLRRGTQLTGLTP